MIIMFHDRSDRARLEVSGPDRAKFLHNLTTNDVKRLAMGHGQESFVTSPQGKTLGYVTLLATEDRIVVRTDPGGFAQVLPHFQKYGIFDDVAIEEIGASTFEIHLAGPGVDSLIRTLGGEPPDAGDLRHRLTHVSGITVRIVRECPTGLPGITLLGPAKDLTAVSIAVHEAGGSTGLLDVGRSTFDQMRIEAGTPLFGRDVAPENLPQEVGRDALAINFVKGCYLGQETVARIDAIGHVNKILRGLEVAGTEPPGPGAAIDAGGKPAGLITSAAFSEASGRIVALGYIRTAQANPGTEVRVAIGAPDEGRWEAAIVRDLALSASRSSAQASSE